MAESTETTETIDKEVTDTDTQTRVDSGAELTLTQEDVDRVVESRLARERKKFEGYDEFKEKAEAYDEAVAASQTELERTQAERDELAKTAEELADANQYVAIRSTILQELAKPENKIVDPEGALEFLIGADQDLLTLDEDGLPINVDETVQKLTQKRSYLVAVGTAPQNVDQGAQGGQRVDQLSEADLQNMSPKEIVEARSEGRLDDVLQGD